MTFAALDDHTVDRLRLMIPKKGLWWASLDLLEDVQLSGSVELRVSDLALRGAIVSGGAVNGRSSYRVVAGAGGWGREIPAQGYHNDLGVKRATLLNAVAGLVGETVAGVGQSDRVGTHYTRPAGAAYVTLNQLLPEWYVDNDGVTQAGARPEVQYAGEAPRMRHDLENGVVELAPEQVQTLLPGVNVDGYGPATDIEFALEGDRLSAIVYFKSSSGSRKEQAFRKLLDAVDPGRRFGAIWEYRVVSQSGDRLNLQPVRTANGMPDLENVPVRPGMAGLRAQVLPGELVLVCFADRDPSRPQVISHDAVGDPGWMPLELALGEDPTLGVARQTDAVVAGPFSGTITFGSTRIKAGL